MLVQLASHTSTPQDSREIVTNGYYVLSRLSGLVMDPAKQLLGLEAQAWKKIFLDSRRSTLCKAFAPGLLKMYQATRALATAAATCVHGALPFYPSMHESMRAPPATRHASRLQ